MLWATWAAASQLSVGSLATMRPNRAISTDGAALRAFCSLALSSHPSTARAASALACAMLIKNSAFASAMSFPFPGATSTLASLSAFSASSTGSASEFGASAAISSATISTIFLVRCPTLSDGRISSNMRRMARFHACEDTLARVAPP